VTPEELSTEVAAGTLRPAYLLYGEEPLLRDEALAAIEAAVLVDGADEFNLERLDGDTTTPAQLRDAVGILPMLAARRLVVLRDPSVRRNKSLADAIAEVVPELAGQERVVLVVTSPKADKRGRWFKAFEAAKANVECEAPKGARPLTAFVRAEAKRQGLGLEKGVAELLVERIGSQLLLLRQEIAKLALVAGGQKIQLVDAEVSTSQVAEVSIFHLSDSIGSGRSAEALALLARMQAAGAAPQAVLVGLAYHFRSLLRVSNGSRAGIPPYKVKNFQSQARRYTEARLVTCLSAIHDADLQFKGGSKLDPAIALERLVIGLAS